MPTRNTDLCFEFLSPESLQELNYQQKVLYSQSWTGLLDYLRKKGKNPDRMKGYAESNIRPIARRIHQAHQYSWEHGSATVDLGPEQADDFICALNKDEKLNKWGKRYAEDSKRKFAEALQSYFVYRELDWEPKIRFSDRRTGISSDPFHSRERELLLNAAFEYYSPPTYSNVSSVERDRWNAHIAQYLGKPKAKVGPDDWEALQTDWKIPSLISTTLDCAWRAAMVGRLKTGMINLDAGTFVISGESAVKNNQKWESEMSERSVKILRHWLKQRENKVKYDNSDHIWLNRQGSPYNSATLNDLLRNLIDEAELSTDSRKLTWHSIRHSTGMYIYNQEKDLELVAECLRQASLEAARRYAHPTPETKKDVIESIQGDVQL